MVDALTSTRGGALSSHDQNGSRPTTLDSTSYAICAAKSRARSVAQCRWTTASGAAAPPTSPTIRRRSAPRSPAMGRDEGDVGTATARAARRSRRDPPAARTGRCRSARRAGDCDTTEVHESSQLRPDSVATSSRGDAGSCRNHCTVSRSPSSNRTLGVKPSTVRAAVPSPQWRRTSPGRAGWYRIEVIGSRFVSRQTSSATRRTLDSTPVHR